jgi:hypothetical protein
MTAFFQEGFLGVFVLWFVHFTLDPFLFYFQINLRNPESSEEMQLHLASPLS